MPNMQRLLTETITHWSVTPDGRGGFVFNGPNSLKGRWEFRAENFIALGGEQRVSQAIVYLDTDVAVGDYLYEGISLSADPTLVLSTYRVEQFFKIANLRNLDYMRKAVL